MLSVQDLAVSYGGTIRALEDVELSVAQGEVVALLGNNGAGKSTLLRALSGILPFQGGRIRRGTVSFLGEQLDGLAPQEVVARGLAQVPEGRRIFASLTVEENLRAGAIGTKDRAARKINRAVVLDMFPVLAERLRQQAGLLSGGEQQMLAIGRALMSRPRMLLLDEPSLGLSPQMVARVGEIVATLRQMGTTVLLVEQNAAMALDVANRAYVMETGNVTELSTSGTASSELAQRFLGHTGVEVDRRSARPTATLSPWVA